MANKLGKWKIAMDKINKLKFLRFGICSKHVFDGPQYCSQKLEHLIGLNLNPFLRERER